MRGRGQGPRGAAPWRGGQAALGCGPAALFLIAAALATTGAVVDDETCPGAVDVEACTGPQSPGELLALIANSSTYDKTARPPPCEDDNYEGPTVVEVQMRLSQLNTVDPKQGIIVLNGYFRTWWKDPRLAYDNSCVDAINFAGSMIEGIWTPDIYFDNLVQQTVQGMEALIQVYPDGRIWRSEQILVTVKTDFDLAKLPHEEHTAKIIVASYSQDITQIRVTARGGHVGPGVSGIGISAAPTNSSLWFFPEGAETEGFKTPGSVEVSGGWDYLTISWKFSRQPRYFTSQVIVPCVLFLLVTYTGFWVDAAVVPARAFLAVLPVLIMRALSNSIYEAIPQGSQFMWLDLFVQISMFLCVAAALHFGVVQAWRVVEAKKAAKLAGLVKAKPIAEKVTKLSRRKKVTLMELLRRYAPVEKVLSHEAARQLRATALAESLSLDDCCASQELGTKEGQTSTPETPPSPAGEGELKVTVSSEEAIRDGVSEADCLFILYARQIFQNYDKDGSGQLSTAEIRSGFVDFNIYMSLGQVSKVVAMFLRDSGHASLLKEKENVLRFSQFCALLTQIDRYSLKLGRYKSARAYYQSIPPSERWDVGARVVFPLLIALQFLVMYSMLAVL